jgi:hypothetical protein
MLPERQDQCQDLHPRRGVIFLAREGQSFLKEGLIRCGQLHHDRLPLTRSAHSIRQVDIYQGMYDIRSEKSSVRSIFEGCLRRFEVLNEVP